MSMRFSLWIGSACLAASSLALSAAEPPPPSLTSLSVTNGQPRVVWTPYPSTHQYKIFTSPDPLGPFVEDASGTLNGFSWTGTSLQDSRYFRIQALPLSSNLLLSSIVLNRLAYGPTPDELTRITAIGPQAYIDEQLAPELIEESLASAFPNFAQLEAKFPGPTDFVTSTNSTLDDLRAWFLLRATGSRRQLLEVLLQFFDNHFVTQYSKSRSYLNTFYPSMSLRNQIAVSFEHRELERWRTALMRPDCTFYDLLEISAESPAMIVYLDTVNSRGDGTRIANENYARELLELFCNGVDNGYDQADIVEVSKAWTGWTVGYFDAAGAANPHATPISGSPTNTPGVWALRYRSDRHNSNAKTIFPGKTVPARFGAPYTTKAYAGNSVPGLYELKIPARTGTNGMLDGYDVIRHLADLPFTQEYISVKLCRLFVHDNFAHGYDFTDPELSAEGQLVQQCMLAWESGTPRGNLRDVLRVIFNSDLFRGHSAAGHKVKTPLELAVSTIRALRSTNTLGGFTATTDGLALITPLNRMGSMLLFDRDEPNGYPETGPAWINAGTLAERIRFVQSVNIRTGQSGKSDAGNNNITDPVGLLKSKTSSATWNNAGAVADYFLDILFLGEGRANLDLYRSAAIEYLNTDDTNIPPQSAPFSNLSNTSTAYEDRVRGMVAYLMSLPRFQEQ